MLGDSSFIKLSSFRTAHDACAAQSSYQSCHLWRCILGASAAGPLHPFARSECFPGQLWLHYPSWQCPLQKMATNIDKLFMHIRSNWHAHTAVRNSSETNPKHVQLGFDIFGLWASAVDLLLSLCQANPLLEWSPWWGDPLWSIRPLAPIPVMTLSSDPVNCSYLRSTYLVCVSKTAVRHPGFGGRENSWLIVALPAVLLDCSMYWDIWGLSPH